MTSGNSLQVSRTPEFTPASTAQVSQSGVVKHPPSPIPPDTFPLPPFHPIHLSHSRCRAAPWAAACSRPAPSGLGPCPAPPRRGPRWGAPPGSSAPWHPSPGRTPGSPTGTGSPRASAAARACLAPTPGQEQEKCHQSIRSFTIYADFHMIIDQVHQVLLFWHDTGIDLTLGSSKTKTGFK